MSKPWGGVGVGAWAADAERAEAEEREAAAAAAAEPQSFPSLKEAVITKPKKKKMSYAEFYAASSGAGSGGGSRATGSKGLTTDEMLRLPTGPKERTPEEMQYGRSGGGFSSYDRSSGPPSGRTRDEGDGSWGGGRRSYGGFDEERRGPPSRVSDYDQPSRADEVDNWAISKKPLPSMDSGRQNRYSSLGGGGLGGASRADGTDSWAVGKKQLPTRSSNFGSGFRDSGPEPDRWTRGGSREPERERPRLVLDSPKVGSEGSVTNEPVKTNKTNPFGAARPREDILAEKGLDWKKLDMEIESKKTSRPTSGHSSRPSSAQSNRSEGLGAMQHLGVENVVKPRPKVNPFGDAKPREVLLEERGKNWRKIDLELEHRGVDRPETEEEKLLKEELDHLKKELEKESSVKASQESPQGDRPSLQDTIIQKESELEILIRELDDKVRFGQKAIERPGSGAGRGASFAERPPSRSGSVDDSRSVEFTDRPRSRGTGGDMWARHGDDRRSFQGGRERGFLGNREMDRPSSRERW
ncbi:eukaryotic translation initiation factor 4B family protein [Tripterygium wilfordii]|uniref:Eukaryotic translation initiation factor 4B family protein n=1 Tax=Tripterygium wilfordii TaxID=458696 RepID=A0A7J7D4X4_TRIWF|nr:eukaryotic translation initiation factor 4B2-like [Tripterygium wilfordii]KAF5741106.1 eukaryotic translation initiation factor 4B family protein [Tripterygium wilfordii]